MSCLAMLSCHVIMSCYHVMPSCKITMSCHDVMSRCHVTMSCHVILSCLLVIMFHTTSLSNVISNIMIFCSQMDQWDRRHLHEWEEGETVSSTRQRKLQSRGDSFSASSSLPFDAHRRVAASLLTPSAAYSCSSATLTR